MFPGKIITGILITLVIFGCTKKKVQTDTEFSQPSSQTAQVVKSDGMDIFDEFYKDEPAQTEQPASKPSTVSQPVKKNTKQTVISSSSGDFSANGRYVIQISTVRMKSFADNLASKLVSKGYPAYVVEVQNPKPELPGSYYRVRIGGFPTIVSARNFGDSNLRPDGFDFWVDYKSNDNVGIDGTGFGSGNSVSF